jgi:DNA-binding NarL/FixJ family response regulator
MNAEIRMGSSLGFEHKRKQKEYRQSYSGPMVQGAPRPRFTPREMDLLRELVRGDGGVVNKEIGFRLGITAGTVKIYMHQLQSKLNLQTRTAIALYAERSGMFRECPGESPSLVGPADETARLHSVTSIKRDPPAQPVFLPN